MLGISRAGLPLLCSPTMAISYPDSDILQLWVLSPVLSADYVDLRNPGLGYTTRDRAIYDDKSLHHFYLASRSFCTPSNSLHIPRASSNGLLQAMATPHSVSISPAQIKLGLDPGSVFDSHYCLSLLFSGLINIRIE